MPQLPNFIAEKVLRGNYVFLDLRGKDRSGLSVACAGWEECSPDYLLNRKGFRYRALEYIAGGDWELQTARGKWVLQPGMIFTYGPDTSFSLRPLSKGGLSKYFIDFSGHTAEAHLQRCGLKEAKPGMLIQRRWLQDLLDQLIETSQMRTATRRRVATLIADLLLERIREDLRPAEHTSQARLTYERCRQYLADHYLEISNLADAARTCGVSQVHLSRLFQRFGTQAPHAFVTSLKMNHAAERITRGNLPVKKAAAEVGFDDAYHFSRVFKKVYGTAPSHFAAR